MISKQDIKFINNASFRRKNAKKHKSMKGEHFFSPRTPDWGLEEWCVTGNWPGLEESFPGSGRIILKLRRKRISLYFHK